MSLERDISRQYVSSLSILAIALFVGIPIWWKTTEVYRCPLPYKAIGELNHKHVPPELVLKISIAILTDAKDGGHGIDSLVVQLRKELVTGSISARTTRVAIHHIIQSHPIGSADRSKLLSYLSSANPEDFSNHFSDMFPSSLGHYYILLIPDCILSHDRKSPPNDPWMETSIFVGKHRHTLIQTKDETDLSSSLPDILKVIKSVYGNKNQLEKSLKSSAHMNQDRVDIESMRELRPTQGYQLSFTLINPNPSQMKATWNIQDATDNILVKFLDHPGISSLGNFSISSQEFHYTDVKFQPKRDGNEFFVSSTHLPPMISSVESKLASHVSQYPSLNFLVYIPKQTESPLFIRPSSTPSDRLSQTDSFLVPQWGGVIIYNPPELSQSKSVLIESDDGISSNDDGDVSVKMEKLMPIFIQQLKMLLGFPNNAFSGKRGRKISFSSDRHGISDWQVDQLLMGKLMESASMATTSLISLVQLLDKVKNMVISDHIQEEVEHSLSSIQECYAQAAKGNLDVSYLAARQAMQSAEVAFFDPSILELLYFPDDQKFAIYIPLFLPISVPILLSSMAALKWLSTRVKGTGSRELDETMTKKRHTGSETVDKSSKTNDESTVEKTENAGSSLSVTETENGSGNVESSSPLELAASEVTGDPVGGHIATTDEEMSETVSADGLKL